MKRLGAIPSNCKTPRLYRNMLVPFEFLVFSDAVWPQNTTFKSDNLSLKNISFFELDIDERDQFSFFKENPNTYIFGSCKDCLMVTKIEAGLSYHDPDIFIIDESNPDGVDGPFKFSDVMKTLETE